MLEKQIDIGFTGVSTGRFRRIRGHRVVISPASPWDVPRTRSATRRPPPPDRRILKVRRENRRYRFEENNVFPWRWDENLFRRLDRHCSLCCSIPDKFPWPHRLRVPFGRRRRVFRLSFPAPFRRTGRRSSIPAFRRRRELHLPRLSSSGRWNGARRVPHSHR